MLAYAASYFARGWLAGHQWFGLYGGLVFLEATARLLFALAVAVGLAEGQTAVALGMAAAPIVSLVVVPLAFARRPTAGAGGARRGDELGLARGGRFAVAVLAIMLAEQTLLNAAVLTTDLTADDAAAAGFVFNALLIARAPLQLFQAIQGSLLPHLAGLEATATGRAEAPARCASRCSRSPASRWRVALGLLVLGPWAMNVLFDDAAAYGRWGLVLVALGMGFHLMAGTLNQAALARDHAGRAAAAWLLAAAVFVAWLVAPLVEDRSCGPRPGTAGRRRCCAGCLQSPTGARRVGRQRSFSCDTGGVVAADMAHTIEHDPIEHGHLVAATGELDLAATPELSTILLMAAEAPGTTVVLDLAGVEFIDSTALGTILKAGSEIESAGKTLRVVCAGGPVRRLLEMTNLTNRFELCPSREVALTGA